ncbi:hypothetical protein [Streptomyces sp. cg2]|uniref:hypothetical protein n=1 Tax=Streptomyces sp. cg2 TaxID=3238799 RepID=UPI0034E2A0C7
MPQLRTTTIPAPVPAGGRQLNAAHLYVANPVTREAATDVHARLATALEGAAPGR